MILMIKKWHAYYLLLLKAPQKPGMSRLKAIHRIVFISEITLKNCEMWDGSLFAELTIYADEVGGKYKF